MNIWDILGIPSNSDVNAIRKAYASKARQYHPEEYPDEFRQLNEAYKSAIVMASRQKGNRHFVRPQSTRSPDYGDEAEKGGSEQNLHFDSQKNKPEPERLDFKDILTGSDEDPKRLDAEYRRAVLQELLGLFKRNEKKLAVWRSLLQCERFVTVMNQPQFIGEFTNIILDRYLSTVRFAVCKEIKRVYFESGQNNPAMPPYRQLSKVLEQQQPKAARLYFKMKLNITNYIQKCIDQLNVC